jgi:hypothetical protein
LYQNGEAMTSPTAKPLTATVSVGRTRMIVDGERRRRQQER